MDTEREKKLYEKEVGPVETRFPDDPDWRYRGRKEEKEAMLDRHHLRDEELPPAVLEGQEELPLGS